MTHTNTLIANEIEKFKKRLCTPYYYAQDDVKLLNLIDESFIIKMLDRQNIDYNSVINDIIEKLKTIEKKIEKKIVEDGKNVELVTTQNSSTNNGGMLYINKYYSMYVKYKNRYLNLKKSLGLI